LSVELGRVIPVIDRVAEISGADLIVMGTHGASGLREYSIGSHTEKVVRHGTAPVIAVKQSVDRIQNIVFPVPPEGDSENIMMNVKQLQDLFSATLHLLFVNTPLFFHSHTQAQARMETLVSRHMLQHVTANVLSDFSEEAGIISFAKTVANPMVAIPTHGRWGITHLFRPSIAEDVVNHIQCPVWTSKIK
jgi:nucleotide-binding universal stress UspA family protein